MQTITPLPQELVVKIAAGEVIERPMFAVKELVENALDAHATSITIEIEKSGLKRIRVTDNGDGMSKEDVFICFQPHTTSKLHTEEELYRILSFGFRGEALASIASISTLRIQSRQKEAIGGTFVELAEGVLVDSGPVGMPGGTIVDITNLFSTVPARKKFLKSNATEFRHIVEIVMHYAMSQSTVRFRLLHNKKEVFDLLPVTHIAERIRTVLGKTIFEQFVPVSFNDAGITISGYIAKPQVSAQNMQKQYMFVNQRKVWDKTISQAVKEGYGSLLTQTSYPIFVLFTNIPYEMVDINIHPRKEIVQFVNNRIVFDVVASAIRATLEKYNLTFTNSISLSGIYKKGAERDEVKSLKEENFPWSVKDVPQIEESDHFILHKTYILGQTKRGILLTDFHAAHERILYEQFQEAFLEKKRKKEIYFLKSPITIELSLAEKALIEEHKNVLLDFGFHFTLAKKHVILTAVPVLFRQRDNKTLLRELLEDMQEEKIVKTLDSNSRRILAYIACRSAVKAGEVLSKKECRNLLEKLAKTKNGYTCPHGRPTQIEIPIEEFHKMFKRL